MISQTKSVNTWFRNIILTLALLSITYVILHLCFPWPGHMYIKLTANDITEINLILNNNVDLSKTDSQPPVEVNKPIIKTGDSGKINNLPPVAIQKKSLKPSHDDTIKFMAISYIFSKYKPASPEDSVMAVRNFSKFDLKTFSYIVSQFPLKTKSFFWLGGNGWTYLEILFWSLFGLICSLLYNVSEAVSQKKFNENENPVHLAKLCYTPFLALIIYLAFDILTLNKDINVSQFGTGMIVFAFILGFFSRRAIDLLDRIKEIILPGKSREPDAIPTEPSEAATPEIIEEAIQIKGEEWVNSFPNVTGFSVRQKVSDNDETGEVALIFKVVKKEKIIDFGKIPKNITYLAKDGKNYNIITDVIQEEFPTPHIAKQDGPPFELGISISREYDNDATGSVGLLLQKHGVSDKKYIISCYHVFCSPELMNNNKTFSSENLQAILRCPSCFDKGTNKIGHVIMGQVNSESDFAIAELKDDFQFTNTLFSTQNSPNGFKTVVPEDKNKSVKMCGRTSGFKTGKIKSHYASQTIDYKKNGVTQYIKGLVEIDPISQGGDSGAPVLDENNKVIGLIVSGNATSSYVLPVFHYIDNNDFELMSAV